MLDARVNGVNIVLVETTNTRQALLRAAQELLIDEGFGGLSMRRVAARCGVSATAIYRHFEDKDALLCAAVVDGFRLFGTYLMQSLKAPTPRERLRVMGQRYFDFAFERPHEYQVIFMLDCSKMGLSKLDEHAKKEIDGTFVMLMDRLKECQDAGVVRAGDTRALAVYYWSTVHGLASLMLSGGLDVGPEENRKLVEQQLELLLRAVAS